MALMDFLKKLGLVKSGEATDAQPMMTETPVVAEQVANMEEATSASMAPAEPTPSMSAPEAPMASAPEAPMSSAPEAPMPEQPQAPMA